MFGGVLGRGWRFDSGSDSAWREGERFVLCRIGVCGGVSSVFDFLDLWLPSDFDLGLPLAAGSTKNGIVDDLLNPDLVSLKTVSFPLELFELKLTVCLSLFKSDSNIRLDITKWDASVVTGAKDSLVVSSTDATLITGFCVKGCDENGSTDTKNLPIPSY